MKDQEKIVEFGYDKVADKHLAGRDKFSNLKYLQKLTDKLSDQASILDLGCGAGVPIDKYLVESGFDVLGVDISEKQISLAEANIPKGKFLKENISEFKTKQKFDAIVSFYTIFHLPKESHFKLLVEMNGFLKAGGYILITMGADDWEGVEDFYGESMAWSHFGEGKNLKLVQDAGFKVLYSKVDESAREKHLVILAQKQ